MTPTAGLTVTPPPPAAPSPAPSPLPFTYLLSAGLQQQSHRYDSGRLIKFSSILKTANSAEPKFENVHQAFDSSNSGRLCGLNIDFINTPRLLQTTISSSNMWGIFFFFFFCHILNKLICLDSSQKCYGVQPPLWRLKYWIHFPIQRKLDRFLMEF